MLAKPLFYLLFSPIISLLEETPSGHFRSSLVETRFFFLLPISPRQIKQKNWAAATRGLLLVGPRALTVQG